MYGSEYISNSPYCNSCAQNNAAVWCIRLHAREHVHLYLHHADEKRSHKQALNGSCLSHPFFFQRSGSWSSREAAEQTGLQGRRGHRASWEEGQPGSHTSFPSMGSSSNSLKELTANSLRRHGIVPLIPALHLQIGGKHCRKEQDPNRAPAAATGAGGVGLRRAWEGSLEQTCYKLWAEQTCVVSWGNCCTVVLNQAAQRTRWQIATRCRERRAIKSSCAWDMSLFF